MREGVIISMMNGCMHNFSIPNEPALSYPLIVIDTQEVEREI